MPAEMLAITAPRHTDPSRYELSTVARPTVTDETDVVMRVHAASVNPIDVKKADGAFKIVIKETFPYQMGYDAAGVVTEVGNAVKRVRVGDEVYTQLPEAGRGAWGEYAKCPEQFVALKPKNLSFAEAASLPLTVLTVLQGLRKYRGSLEGKTVFVPAGLSGTGAVACQMAKNVFRAGKVITTVSTSKVPKVPELLGESVVDEVIDYTKQDPSEAIPARSVDFLFDTTGQAMEFLSLIVPSTGMALSISTMPSGTTLQAASVMRRPDNPQVPLLVRLFLDAADGLRSLRAWRWGVEYVYLFVDPSGAELDEVRGFVEAGKVVPIVGTRVGLRDVEGVREACRVVYKAKGGLGKTVLDVYQG